MVIYIILTEQIIAAEIFLERFNYFFLHFNTTNKRCTEVFFLRQKQVLLQRFSLDSWPSFVLISMWFHKDKQCLKIQAHQWCVCVKFESFHYMTAKTTCESYYPEKYSFFHKKTYSVFWTECAFLKARADLICTEPQSGTNVYCQRRRTTYHIHKYTVHVLQCWFSLTGI